MKRILLAFVPLALAGLVGCNGAGGRSGETSEEQVQPGSDQERLQGMWEIVAFETARPGEGPGPDKMKAIRLTFTGDKLTISVGGDYRVNFLVALDPGKDPKRMTVTELIDGNSGPRPTQVGTAPKAGTSRASNKPEDRSEWLYKFEGDTLVIAVADPGQPAPKDFTPRGFATAAATSKTTAPAGPPGGRVDIVRLKKTTVPGIGQSGFGTAGTYRGTYRRDTAFSTGRIGTGRITPAPSTAKK